MKASLFLFLMCMGFCCFSQPLTFNQKYSFNYPAAIIQGIVGNGDSIVFSGFVGDSFPPYPNRSFIGVANQQGEIQCFHILDTTNKDYWIYPASLTKSKYGNYYFTSGIYSEKYTANLGKIRAFIGRLDHNLDTVYIKHYAPPITTDAFVMDNHLEYHKDTLFLMCTLDKYNAQGNFYDDDLVIVITDSLGNEITRKQFVDNAYRHSGCSIVNCNSGVLIASRKLKRYYDNGVWKWEYSPNVLLLDSQGNVLKAYNASSLDYRASLWAAATKDNNYVFCGSKVYNIIHPLGSPNTAQQIYKGYIEKLDSNFQKLWGLELGSDSNLFSTFTKIIEAENGDYIAIGRNWISYKTILADTTITDSNTVAGWIVRVSSSGNKIWERYYRVVYGHDSQNYLGDIYEQLDGSIVMCGYVYDDAPSPITNYGWLLKTDSFGCLVPGCELVGIAENTPLESSIKLYPNPTSDRLFLYYNNPQLQNCVFTIRDMTGREIVPQTALQNSTTYEIVTRDWAAGLYFVRVQDENGHFYSEKFVKE